MSVIVRRRSRLAVLAVLGLVGSLLAVAAAPSGAAGDGKPSNRATYSACVAAATSDAGFTDMDGGHAKAAANCLAHYGITTGTAPGMYSPSASVTRAQMAVFLSRAAGPAGLDLGAATDQGFADIGGYSMTFQDAINRVAKAGIMKGASRTMFSPDAAVSRADMAVFLDGFVGKAMIGPGGLGGASKYADVKPDDDPFTDIGGVPFGAYGSIRKVYELGIASGTGMGMFSPDASVTRNQMALFITRALAHTNARPAGLSLQANRSRTDTNTASSFMLHAAHRSSSHMPMANTTLDMFSAGSASAAFDQNGLCKTLASGVSDPVATGTRCVIDTADETTDSEGNAVVEVTGTNDYCAGGKRIWAWTGAVNARFDNDTTTTDAHVDIGVSKHWRSINVSSDLNKHTIQLRWGKSITEYPTYQRFGQSVTYTFQLVDDINGKGNAVAQKDVELTIKFVETIGNDMRDVTRMYKTDASGKVVLTFSYNDPNPAATGQTIRIVLWGMSNAHPGPAPATGGPQATPKNLDTVIWTDAAAKPARLFLSHQPEAWSKATSAGVRATVEGLVVDQFGDPVAGVPVSFFGDGNNGNTQTWDDGIGGRPGRNETGAINEGPTLGLSVPGLMSWASAGGDLDRFAATVRTNSRGIARHSYFRNDATAWVEAYGAVAQVGLRDRAPGTPTDEDDDIWMHDFDTGHTRVGANNQTGVLQVHQHDFAPKLTTENITNDIVWEVNKEANELVIEDVYRNLRSIRWVSYDSNDHFYATSGGSTTAISMEAFENLIAVTNRVTVVIAANPSTGVNKFTRTDPVGLPPAPTTCHN